MVTRRTLLAAGGAAVLAGCGPTAKKVYSTDQVLGQQRQALADLTAAFDGLSRADRAKVGKLADRADRRLEKVGGTRASAPGSTTLEDVLAAEQAALRAHVAGVGETTDLTTRTLLSGLIPDTAQDTSTLLLALERDPIVNAFPGEPAA